MNSNFNLNLKKISISISEKVNIICVFLHEIEGKRADRSPDGKRSALPIYTRNTRGDTDLLPVF